jgi:hypothetical protein
LILTTQRLQTAYAFHRKGLSLAENWFHASRLKR